MLGYVTPIALNPNNVIVFNERRHKVLYGEDGHYVLDPLTGAKPKRVPARDISLGFQRGKVRFLGNSVELADPIIRLNSGYAHQVVQADIDDLKNDAHKKEVRRRWEYVRALQLAVHGQKSGAGFQDLINGVATRLDDKKPPRPRTVFYWRARFESHGGSVKALLRKGAGSTLKREEAFSPLMLECIRAAFDEKYVRAKKGKLSHAVENAIERINLINDGILASNTLPDGSLRSGVRIHKIPSRATLYRYLKRMIDYETLVQKHGRDVARMLTRHNGGIHEAEKPLDLVQIDSTKLPIWCWVAPDVPPQRPWCTTVYDVCTHHMIGFYLGFEDPDIHSSLEAIRVAIAPKDWVATEYPDIKSEWIAAGTMVTVQGDNGSQFPESFRDTLASEGIGWQAIPPHTPTKNSGVERKHKDMQEFLMQLPGAVGMGRDTLEPAPKLEDLQSGKIEILTKHQLAGVLIKYEIEGKNSRFERQHDSLGESPRDKWLRLCDGVRPPISK